jgi:CDGSH-type Zn-finger protein
MTTPAVPQKAPYPVEVEAGKSYWWCSCGLSKKQPFCDGSHAGSGFQPVKFVAEEAKKMFFCGCKASKNQPFCDGGHKNLP